jgi:hypothetical protein
LVPHTTIVHFLNKQSIMRQITIFFFCLGFLLPINALMAQAFLDEFNGTLNSETTPGYRSGRLGIGFTDPYSGATGFGTALGAIPRARFAVSDGILAHYGDQGEIGDLANSTWCGLGLAGPAAPGTPYGLAMARGGSVGFLNLIPGTNGEDLIAGFGAASGTAANRFILRAYNNAGSGRSP